MTALSTSIQALATPPQPQTISLPSQLNMTSLSALLNTTSPARAPWPTMDIPIDEYAHTEYFKITGSPEPLTADPHYTMNVVQDMITILNDNLSPSQRIQQMPEFQNGNGVVFLGFKMLSNHYLDSLAAYEMFSKLTQLEHAFGAASVVADICDGICQPTTKIGIVYVSVSLRSAASE